MEEYEPEPDSNNGSELSDDNKISIFCFDNELYNGMFYKTPQEIISEIAEGFEGYYSKDVQFGIPFSELKAIICYEDCLSKYKDWLHCEMLITIEDPSNFNEDVNDFIKFKNEKDLKFLFIGIQQEPGTNMSIIAAKLDGVSYQFAKNQQINLVIYEALNSDPCQS